MLQAAHLPNTFQTIQDPHARTVTLPALHVRVLLVLSVSHVEEAYFSIHYRIYAYCLVLMDIMKTPLTIRVPSAMLNAQLALEGVSLNVFHALFLFIFL